MSSYNWNLLKGTATPEEGTEWTSSSLITAADGILTLTPTTSAALSKYIAGNALLYENIIGKTVTVSFDYKTVSGGTYSAVQLLLYTGFSTHSRNNSTLSSSYDRYVSATVTTSAHTEWTRYSKTFLVDDTSFVTGKEAALTAGSYFAVELYAGAKKAAVQIKNVKLELGSEDTGWTPAADDTDCPEWEGWASVSVKAKAQTSLSIIRDVSATYRYYKLQSSTANPPAKPTSIDTLPPSGWSVNEPEYSSSSTDTLYTVDLTVFTDDTFSYSNVMTSSAYEAAKAAYNRAVSAATAAAAAANAVGQMTELIVGTQTAATASWTGVSEKLTELTDGTSILYWLPYASASNVTLNLTLAGGGTTGAIPCYYGGTTRLGTHYVAGSVIRLTYRVNGNIAGTNYTGWWADANYNYDSNNYDRIRYQQVIKAGSTAIVAKNIIVAGADNAGTYTHLKLGHPFDISYPILYANAGISANGTGNNNYLVLSFAIATTQSMTLTAYKAVYIKGTLDGTTFTPISTTPLTQTIPTEEDGYSYILLGTAYSTSAIYLLLEHPVFQYYHGGFKTTSQIAAEAQKKADDLQTQVSANSDAIGSLTSTVEAVTTTQAEFNTNLASISSIVAEHTTVMDELRSSISTAFEQTKDYFNFTFTTQADLDTFKQYIKFVEGNILLGRSDSGIVLKITNERISFMSGDTEVAYISDMRLYITDAVFLAGMHIGDWSFVQRSNRHLTLTWIGGAV